MRFGLWVLRCLKLDVGDDDDDDDDVGITDDDDEWNCSTCGGGVHPVHCVCLHFCVCVCLCVCACACMCVAPWLYTLHATSPRPAFLGLNPSNMAVLSIDVDQLCNSSSLVVWPVTLYSD